MCSKEKGTSNEPDNDIVISMQLFINTSNGTIVINIKSNDTIKDIKQEINDKKGIQIEHQQLFYQGQQLQNDKPLKYYEIQPFSVLKYQTSFIKTFIVNVDISEILPFVPFEAKAFYKIQCQPNLSFPEVFEKLDIEHIVNFVKPVVITSKFDRKYVTLYLSNICYD